MKNNDLIHVQLEYEKGLESKKNLLLSEMKLLEVKKFMRAYSAIREAELKSKAKLYRRLKEIMILLERLNKNIPKIEVPKEILQKNETKQSPREIKQKPYDMDLEKELLEIQRKLRSLEM